MFDKIFGWFESFVQGFALQSILQHFQWVDWLTVGFALLGIVMGIRNGMMGELGGIIEISIVNFFVFEYRDWLKRFIMANVREIPVNVAEAVSFLVLAAAIWFVVSAIFGFLGKLFHAEVAPSLRMIGGAVLGVIRFLIVFSFFSQFILLLPFDKIKVSYYKGQSYTGEGISKIAPKLHEAISNPYHLFTGKK
ncbi:MAG: CvpA family protein [Candidatus Omnitrophica bacterium]|nr:CvpA family protein [Candidatus Omnitrophota bacterium]